jgi:hypothetical protein
MIGFEHRITLSGDAGANDPRAAVSFDEAKARVLYARRSRRRRHGFPHHG